MKIGDRISYKMAQSGKVLCGVIVDVDLSKNHVDVKLDEFRDTVWPLPANSPKLRVLTAIDRLGAVVDQRS